MRARCPKATRSTRPGSADMCNRMFGYVCLLYSLPDFALSIGLSSDQAAYINVFLNVSNFVGRVLVGLLSDRFGIIQIAAIATLFTGICTFAIWIPATNYAVTIVFSLLVGGTLGVFWPVSCQMIYPSQFIALTITTGYCAAMCNSCRPRRASVTSFAIMAYQRATFGFC